MARFTSDFKQAFLIALWEKAPETASSLSEAITALILGQYELVSGGYNISSVSGAGHSTSFFIPSNGQGLTPQTLMELGAELRRIYTETAAALASADEAAIYPEMLNRLQAVRRMRDDFTLLTR